MKKRESLVLGSILQKIAPKIGARVLLEPDWGIAGQITFKSGRRAYFRYNTLDLNPVGASDIAKDKDYANFFMEKMGYPIIPGSKTFFSNEWANTLEIKGRGLDDAYQHALVIGMPVIVKPNAGSQGVGVALVHTKQEFYAAMRRIFRKERVALVQKQLRGKDYRVVVLDNEIISAYERIPLNVVGNGRSTVQSLLDAKKRAFKKVKRDTQIQSDDPRIALKLKHQNLSLGSVPRTGERIFLLDNANLSTGGDAIDVTHCVHPFFADIAIRLTKEMGLRLCGVDLMIDGDISVACDTFWVIEINAAPGLDHYAKSGKHQEEIVEALYLKVLKSLDV